MLTGLGLGIAVNVLLDKAEVTDITVLEKEIDVINLVAPTFPKFQTLEKLNIIMQMLLRGLHPKGKIYDFAWHDIFNFRHEIKRDEIKRLNKKYATLANWQGIRLSSNQPIFL